MTKSVWRLLASVLVALPQHPRNRGISGNIEKAGCE